MTVYTGRGIKWWDLTNSNTWLWSGSSLEKLFELCSSEECVGIVSFHPMPPLAVWATPLFTAGTAQFLLISLLVMLLCTAGWDCGYNRHEKWAKVGSSHPLVLLTNPGAGDPGDQHGLPLHGAGLPGGARGVGPHQRSPDSDGALCLDWRILSLDWVRST